MVRSYLDLAIKFHDYSSFFTAFDVAKVLILTTWNFNEGKISRFCSEDSFQMRKSFVDSCVNGNIRLTTISCQLPRDGNFAFIVTENVQCYSEVYVIG